MASVHLALDGMALLGTSDRNCHDANAIVVSPTQEFLAQPGHAAFMATLKDNVRAAGQLHDDLQAPML